MSFTVPKPRPATVWLSRDSDANGVLSREVAVWLQRPKRNCDSLGVWWLTDAVDSLWHRYSVEDAMRIYRTVPDSDYELIRNGEI